MSNHPTAPSGRLGSTRPAAAAAALPPAAVVDGALYVVATPIGNLGDLSPRAQAVLAAVDRVCAEDTRTTGALLAHFGIRQVMQALHDHNEDDAAAALVQALQGGTSLALVSDAGMPLVSDPGYALVAAARAASLPVYIVPGPSAVLAALAISGLPTDRFAFEGFLPSKRAARRRRLQTLLAEIRTWVCFESAHRIADAAEDLAELLVERKVFIARELTKRFEESALLPAVGLPAWLAENPYRCKGEFVLVVQGAPPAEAEEAETRRVLELLLAELPPSAAARVAAGLTGQPRRELYALAMALVPPQT